MAKKIYGKEDWEIFRGHVLDLVILYKHVKEFAFFDVEKLQYIPSFFFLSQKNAITSFYIKLGFLLSNGKPTFKNFLSHDDYNDLNGIYKSKLKDIRDKVYAHNIKTELPDDFRISDDDVDLLYSKIISFAEALDEKYDDIYNYDFVGNTDGIKSIEPFIQSSIELDIIQSALIENGYKGTFELNLRTGKIIFTS